MNKKILLVTSVITIFVASHISLYSAQANEVKDEKREAAVEITCSICLGELKGSHATSITPCNHLFHKTCIQEWIRTQHSCPNCRAVTHNVVEAERALCQACETGNVKRVQILLSHGINVNYQSSIGYTPLCYASLNGHAEVVQLLLNNKANINIKSNLGNSPLHFAATKGHTEVAQLLLAAGADINAINELGNKPLTCALEHDYIETAQLLEEHGAKESMCTIQ